jgi:DNA invertase Pin-like site-specific DNA recombinase
VTGEKVLIGYMRVSKADGSQSTNLQRDALIAAGVTLRTFTRIWPRAGAMIAQGWLLA